MICEFEKGKDHQISEHFFLREFDCHCRYDDCITTLVSIELVEGLEQIREYLAKPVAILSGFRCQKHNLDTGGRAGSKHLLGIAADIQVTGVLPFKLAYAAKRVAAFQNGGIGTYSWGVHVDHRGTPTRW